MFPELIRFAAAADLGLTVAEGTGRFSGLLPLAGSQAAQVGIILGVAVVVHELAVLVGVAWKRLRTARRRRAASARGSGQNPALPAVPKAPTFG